MYLYLVSSKRMSYLMNWTKPSKAVSLHSSCLSCVVLGTSTPAFGQASAGMSVPFGSPGTPGFGAMGASPFGKIQSLLVF